MGAGAAGAVIASRVTERADREVLLLEAGPDYIDTGEPGRLPPDLVDGGRNSWRQHDWGYRHRPTPSQILFVFPRGRVVGGSSAVNTCIALRPKPYDLDEWAALGLSDWSWERCLPYFRRLEDDRDFDTPWHGRGGPVPIRRHPPEELVTFQAAFVEAARALGYPALTDTNDPALDGGVGPHAMNKIDGVRMSAARCYLTPAVRERPGLHLSARTVVRRVVFHNQRVEAVEIERDGRIERIATRKVVLSAGAIATPGILLRSGVGPRDEVARLGVELVADVPAVGAKLLDHPGAALFLLPRGRFCRTTDPLIQTVLRYTSMDSPHPLDMLVQPGSYVPIHPRLNLPLFSIMCCVGKPRGHGTLRFLSADAKAGPHIDSKLLVNRDDHAKAVEAMMLARELAGTAPIRRLARPLWPGARTLADRARIGAWIHRSCDSGYHPCGTVPMGPEGDLAAAVDGRGRVRGVDGLIVADASLMPTIPSVNTHLTTLMIGERFGEWLRDGAL
ncbi:choline dehydrogenase [Chondromyces crocatus]|uniref:Choline dehydrogenase n=1 Tax=Chondromyces crocatus TaxID=52 RepID=A0A0K1ES09_CHOCO|nr:choline dehydrogenase [Chondromyces crocatus]